MSAGVEHLETTLEAGGEDQDWEAVERSAAFRELIARRRRFVLPVTLFAMAWWGAFVLLVSYAEDFMASSIYHELTVAYVLGLSQFLMVWLIVWAYLRTADRELEPLERRVLDEAGDHRRQA